MLRRERAGAARAGRLLYTGARPCYIRSNLTPVAEVISRGNVFYSTTVTIWALPIAASHPRAAGFQRALVCKLRRARCQILLPSSAPLNFLAALPYLFLTLIKFYLDVGGEEVRSLLARAPTTPPTPYRPRPAYLSSWWPPAHSTPPPDRSLSSPPKPASFSRTRRTHCRGALRSIFDASGNRICSC